MVDAARPSCRAIARKLSPSPLSAASRSLSSSLRCVPPDIAPSRFAIPARALPQGPGMLRFTPDSADGLYASADWDALNVQTHHPQRILLNELPSRLHDIAHQRAEDLVGLVGVVDLDL